MPSNRPQPVQPAFPVQPAPPTNPAPPTATVLAALPLSGWKKDNTISIGPNIAGKSMDEVDVLDTTQYPSVAVVAEALASGKLQSNKGICVVRSEQQKLYFLLYHDTKKADAARISNQLFP